MKTPLTPAQVERFFALLDKIADKHPIPYAYKCGVLSSFIRMSVTGDSPERLLERLEKLAKENNITA